METKVLLDYTEYQDLLHIKKLYNDSKKDKSESEDTEDKSSQQGFGTDIPYNLVEQVTEKVLDKIKNYIDSEKKVEKPYSNTDKIEVIQKEAKDSFLNQLNSRIRKRGEILLSKLQSMNDFNLDLSSGEVTIGDTFYKNSDIVKLLRSLLYSHTAKQVVVGREALLTFLISKGFGYLIKNPNLKRKTLEIETESKNPKIIPIDNKAKEKEEEMKVVKEIEMEEFNDNRKKTVIDPKWYCLA